MRRILSVLLAVVLLLSLGITVSAHEVPDLERKGSIEIVVKYDGEPVIGGSLTCIKVGDVHEDDGNYSFVRVIDKVALKNVGSASLAEELAQFAAEKSLTGTTQEIGDDGKVRFTGMKPGLYLIIQEAAPHGFNALQPFLVSLPYMENGTYLYDVTAAIKSELEKEPEPEHTPSTPSDSTLPQTGQLNWPVPILVVLGMGFFVVGWMLRFGRKKEGHEE